MSKKIGVLFSSGLDSTYLVWKNLNDGNQVVPIYIEINNNKVKSIIEKNRIGLLHKEFEKEFNTKIKDIQYIMDVGVLANEDSLYFRQVPIWILGIMFCQSLDIDEIQIGYVGNDDSISYLHDIQKIYKSYQSISNKLIPLKFPLAKKRKWELGQDLPKKYLDLIFSCENANIIGSEDAYNIEYEPCCECAPCKTIISTNYYEREMPQIYVDGILKKKVRELSSQGYGVIDKDGNTVNCWDSVCLKKSIEPYQLTINFDGDIECDIDGDCVKEN